MTTSTVVIGVLALQGAFHEHIAHLKTSINNLDLPTPATVMEVRTPAHLAQCQALVIPGGESTAISLVAESTQLLDPLRQFVRDPSKTIWGTCAGLILLAQKASSSSSSSVQTTRRNQTDDRKQKLIGGLDIRVERNHFGRQTDSFVAGIEIPEVTAGKKPFDCVFIRAPTVEAINITTNTEEEEEEEEGHLFVFAPSLPEQYHGKVRVLATLAADQARNGQASIVAVAQGNRVLGTSFHPELTSDTRLHEWWIKTMVLRNT